MTVNDAFAPAPDPGPLPAAAVKPRSSSSRVLNLGLGLALAIAVAGVAFAVGRGTAPLAATTGPGGFRNGPLPSGAILNGGGPGGLAGGGAGLAIEGTVTAVDADSVTIKTSSGGTIELSIDDGTEYHQQVAADAADVTTGSKVVVQVSGFAGRGDQPGGANASAAPSRNPGSTTGTATDITVVP